jgi:ABC-type amino acid transport substrate-binding protein
MTGQADICFLPIEPAREAEVAFTAPYVLIEGVFAVPSQSQPSAVGDVDSSGVRIGVKRGSAYDLFLSRTLRHARSYAVRTEPRTHFASAASPPRSPRLRSGLGTR